MAEKNIYKGNWWLPNKVSKPALGELEVKKTGDANLSLYEGLPDFTFNSKNRKNFSEIIHGDTNQGKITLYNSNLISSGFAQKHSFSNLQPEFILKNFHLDKYDSPVFTNIALTYTNLLSWINQNHFELKETSKIIEISDKSEKRFTIKISDETSLHLILFTSMYGQFTRPIKYIIEERSIIKIELKTAISFEKTLSFESKIRSFLRFAIGENVCNEYFELQTEKNKNERELSIEVIRTQGAQNVFRNVHPNQMLFTYPIVKEYFDTFLKNWFIKYESLSPVISLYFIAFFSEKIFVQQSFLSAVQALEAFHRKTKVGTVYPKSVYKKNVEEILQTVATHIPQHESWLKIKLQSGNQISLKKMIDELLSDFDEINQILIADNNFSQKITRYRNRFTHNDSKKAARQIDNFDLSFQNQKIKLLLESCILKEMGLPLELINSIIKKKYIHTRSNIKLTNT